MKVLVTGATGTVGRRVVDELLAAGHTVRAMTRNPSAASFPDGVEVVAGDLADPPSLDSPLAGVEAAHLITFAGEMLTPMATADAVVERVEAAGVRRVTVLDGPGSEPVDDAVAASGLRWTRIAPVEFMTNALAWADAVRDEGVVSEAFASAPSTVVHEADIAAVIAAALADDAHHGEILRVTGPQALNVRERVGILADVLGRDLRVVEPTRAEAIEGWREWGLDDETVATFLSWVDDPPAEVLHPLDTVPRLTGRPGRTFAEWVRENADAFRGSRRTP